jgi:hypothetical protein
MEAAMPANKHHGETVDAEPVILAVVAAETVIRNAVAAVTATLLPGAVLRLPAMGTIAPPSDLLSTYMLGAPLLCRPVVLLLTLLALLILLASGLLLLLFCRVGLLLTLLALLVLLPPGLLLLLLALLILLPIGLLLLFRGVVLLLTLLPLLVLLPPGLLLLFCRVVLLLTLLPLLILLPSGLLLFFRFSLLLLLPGLSLRLPFRLGLLLLLRGLSLFFLFLLPCVSRSDNSEQQKKRGRTNDSNWFHGVTSIASTYAPVTRHLGRFNCQAYTYGSICRMLSLVCSLVTQLGFARGNERVQIH